MDHLQHNLTQQTNISHPISNNSGLNGFQNNKHAPVPATAAPARGGATSHLAVVVATAATITSNAKEDRYVLIVAYLPIFKLNKHCVCFQLRVL